MEGLTTALLSRACRIFLALAYPAGEASIPHKKRLFWNIPPGAPLEQYLPPLIGPEFCQRLDAKPGCKPGFAYRLGCSHFPHLKLQVILCEGTWVFCVDTHDGIFPSGLPESNPEAQAWRELVTSSRQLKERIERAWENEGFVTFHTLLRANLPTPD
jgi:hypothetical protein